MARAKYPDSCTQLLIGKCSRGCGADCRFSHARPGDFAGFLAENGLTTQGDPAASECTPTALEPQPLHIASTRAPADLKASSARCTRAAAGSNETSGPRPHALGAAPAHQLELASKQAHQ